MKRGKVLLHFIILAAAAVLSGSDCKATGQEDTAVITSFAFSNDTYADTQWNIDNPGHYIYLSDIGRLNKEAVEGVDMDVIEAWASLKEAAEEKREVIVAIIDTGVDYMHPELVDHMWMNPGEIPDDNIDNDNNGYIDDVYGWDFYNNDATVCHYQYSEKLGKNLSLPQDNDDHGTHVAGIIAASADNGIGIAGVASGVDVKIMSLKINGGPKGTGSLTSAVEAIKYATMMGADICNLSWGTSQYSPSLKQAIEESNMLFVAAAGNSGDNNNDSPIYPAGFNLDNLISVTFIDPAGELTLLSNYGSDTVDLAAPGEDIFSTVVGAYAPMSGSSMAAPQVSAVAAMIYAGKEHIYAADVKKLIIDHIKTMPKLEGYLRHSGIPSANQAILASSDLLQDDQAPSLILQTSYNKGELQIPVAAEDIGPSGIRVVKWNVGEKTLQDFAHGVNGKEIEDNLVTVTKPGKYTFYASDYAGNETIQVYEVLDDTTAPKITTSYTVSEDYKTRTVTVKVSDTQSQVKRLEYMNGIKKAEEFLPASAGLEIPVIDGEAQFKVKEDGTYTVFVIDNRGNMAVKNILVKTVKATKLKLSSTAKTMQTGDQYSLHAAVTPAETTDRITYISSNKTVATVSSAGKIKALKNGVATITVRTSGGLTATCVITVKQNSSA